jgi:hypothetical protein
VFLDRLEGQATRADAILGPSDIRSRVGWQFRDGGIFPGALRMTDWSRRSEGEVWDPQVMDRYIRDFVGVLEKNAEAKGKKIDRRSELIRWRCIFGHVSAGWSQAFFEKGHAEQAKIWEQLDALGVMDSKRKAGSCDKLAEVEALKELQ